MSPGNIKEEITLIRNVTTTFQEESSVIESSGYCEELVFFQQFVQLVRNYAL